MRRPCHFLPLPSLKPVSWRYAAVCLALLFCGGVTSAMAQTTDTESLQRELRLVRQSVTQLESAVYGVDGNQAVASLQVQMQQLLDQMRSLTGAQEVLGNRIRRLEERMDKLTTDTDFRLQALEDRPAPPPETADAPSATPPAAPSVFFPDLTASPEKAAPDGQAASSAVAAPAENPAAASVTPPAAASPGLAMSGAQSPEQQYTLALDLLHNQDFDRAEAAFRDFLDVNPQHRLAENALYWLGETYYVRKRYEQAAVTFGEAYIKYPNRGKASHNLLKLAMSLEQLKRNADACTAYGQLLEKHPDAEQRILQQATAARQRLQCS